MKLSRAYENWMEHQKPWYAFMVSSAVWWEVGATVQAGSLCVDDGYETQRNQAKVISFCSLF